MMTIKEFARLCGCSTQTLRYYDKIDLLKPVKVDPWSGYRYYEKDQAVDFVKIKNLQAADFPIVRIKELLRLSDQQVYAAFEEQIASQMQKLERIREIQRTYLTEINMMKELVHTICDTLLEDTPHLECIREFGLTPEDAPALVKFLRESFLQDMERNPDRHAEVQLTVNDVVFTGTEAMEMLRSLMEGKELTGNIRLNGDSDTQEEIARRERQGVTIWESHNWEHVHEFIRQIPRLEDGREYAFQFRCCEDAMLGNLSFPMFMIGIMKQKYPGMDIEMSCGAEKSQDGNNHFALVLIQ